METPATNVHEIAAATTNGVTVAVGTRYLPEESDPTANVFTHSYHVTLENMTGDSIRLVRRHWIIFSGGVQYAEVRGDGVVGVQPVLGPGGVFEYRSFSIIRDPVGSMQGTYTFVGPVDDEFEVAIPSFDLMYPALVH